MGLLPEMGDNLLQASHALSLHATSCVGVSMHVDLGHAWKDILTISEIAIHHDTVRHAFYDSLFRGAAVLALLVLGMSRVSLAHAEDA